MCCKGKEIDYKDITPEEIQNLRKAVATFIQGRVEQPATALPQGFPLYAQTDPLSFQARDLMSGMMGYGKVPWDTPPPGTYTWGAGPPGPAGPVGPIGPTANVTPGVTVGPSGPGPNVNERPIATVQPRAEPRPGVDIRPDVAPKAQPIPTSDVRPNVVPIPSAVGPTSPSAYNVSPAPYVGPVAIPGLQPLAGPNPYEPVISAGIGPIGPTGPAGPVGSVATPAAGAEVKPGVRVFPWYDPYNPWNR